MKSIPRFLAVSGMIVIAIPAAAALNIFVCEPEWGALVQELAGDKASVYSATTAFQDAHRIEARPSLIARVRTADLLICTGSELEIGWLPLLVQQAGNARVQTGTAGYFEASRYVAKLEVPQVVDRSLGDIHPGGNPHIHTDARNFARVAEALGERLAQIDPENSAVYKSRTRSFLERWRAAEQRWEKQAGSLKGIPVVVYHRDWSYMFAWLGLREVGSLEPRPGIPPTPAHLADLVERMRREPAKFILYSSYNDPRAAEFLSQRAKIPAVMLPFTVGGSDRAKDLFGLFDDIVARLLGAAK